ncbi:MAG: D-lyxose/D-mannose family sugar isomerase [Clostridiales bacterium]|nr:D-lyxose/D-mannose family sugar isomerase [Clostridiales bacterium]
MKRSQINEILREADAFIKKMGFHLPPFAYFKPDKWKMLGDDWSEVRDNMLGWDITDYGHGKFSEIGLTLFTIRNGNNRNARYQKPYAEKLLISEEDQICPNHFHFSKMEDIINRGGGNLMMRIYQSDKTGGLSPEDVTIMTDGNRKTVKAGTVIRLSPGMSITLPPGQYHEFWAERGFGKVLIGEVSSVNDDETDNRFYEKQGRFPEIEEDEPPLFLLCNEYGAAI